MRRFIAGVVVLGCVVGSSRAQEVAEAVPGPPATQPAAEGEELFPSLLAAGRPAAAARIARRAPSLVESERTRAAANQVYLARAGFSPGVIDGKPGRKSRLATEMFQRASGIVPTGTLDGATLAALGATDDITLAYRIYAVTAKDLKDITGPIPTDWNERAKIERSGFGNMEELLAERGWCSPELLGALNPGTSFESLQPGDEVVLPDVSPLKALKLARLEVDLGEKLVKGFDAGGAQTMLLHCSIAKSAEKRPVGELRIERVALDPSYTFNPRDWPEVKNVSRILTIAPGPRCPVGSAWVGLDKPGYGMHGTVRPMDIGKTGSHGCFRLANWDAVRLAKSVKIGMVVEVKE